MHSILVTGGAGYIGSHTVKILLDKNYEVIVIDDLSTGHKEAVLTDHFYQGDIADKGLVTKIIKKHNIKSVIHFAAKSLVAESMEKPDLYFYSNVCKTNELLTTLIENKVYNFIFSSSAAVYGIPPIIPIPENTSLNPINPYGESKLMIEKILKWMGLSYGLKWIALRYFNAAGADLCGRIGEDHRNETHLIPLVLKTYLGQRESINIYGTDYHTPDGTNIRDYIHVLDLAEAHILALEGLINDRIKSGPFNVGTGHGYSVREIIDISKKVINEKINVREAARRDGDPPILIADSRLLKETFDWQPKHSDLETIISSAWRWHRTNPNGYKD